MSISEATANNQKRSEIISLVFISIIQFLFSMFLFRTGFLTDSRNFLGAGTLTLWLSVISGCSVVFLIRGKNTLGVWIFLIGLSIFAPLITYFIGGIGWVSLIAIPLLVAWVANFVLKDFHLRWALTIGIVAGILSFAMDMIIPFFRPTIPHSNILLPLVILIFLILGGILLSRRFQTFTLRTKLLILFLGISLIPIGVLTYLNYNSTRETLTNAANTALHSTGAQTANQIDTFFQNTKNIIQAEAQLAVLREFLTKLANDLSPSSANAAVALSIFQSKDPNHILSYTLLNRSGDVALRYPSDQSVYPPYLGVNTAVENSMRTTLLDAHQYASPVLFLNDDLPIIIFATAVYDTEDDINPVGLLLIEYNASILQELMVAQNELAGEDSFGVLFDNYQIHLAHGTDPSTLFKTASNLSSDQYDALIEAGRLPDLPYDQLSTNLPELSEKLKNSREEPFFSAKDVATGDRINQVATTNINSLPWQIGFFQPQDVYISIVNQQTRNALLFLSTIAVIVTALSFGATRLISTPIVNLANLVEHVAGGNFTLQIPELTQDEIGRLAKAFNALTTQIRHLLGGLELEVSERTKELERQAIQLQTAAEVARDASNLQNLNELLEKTVNLISDRFGFFHAAIFLIDDRDEFAVLRSANSEGGKEMLRRDHKLKIGETGIVGYVTNIGEPRIALDVGVDSEHFAHPFLPETRSEMALPLIVAGKIIGALDVQSIEEDAFDKDDITVLQVLADQLAVAIENTRLLTEVRHTIHELQAAYGEYTKESWQKWSHYENRIFGYRFRGSGIEPITDHVPEPMTEFKHADPSTSSRQPISDQADVYAQQHLEIPIQLRDQSFGSIRLGVRGDQIPADLTEIVDTLANRLATALENARLYEGTQRRIAQEQVTSSITSRMRESLDIDMVLKTAVQEIGKNLDLNDVAIQIDLGNTNPRMKGNPDVEKN